METSHNQTIHQSVMKQELISLLSQAPGEVIVDLTLGGGGHLSTAIKTVKSSTFVGFDLSQQAIDYFEDRLYGEGYEIGQRTDDLVLLTRNNKSEVVLVHDSFAKLDKYRNMPWLQNVGAIYADLGYSSDQLGQVAGLSYSGDASQALDMRYSQIVGEITAADLLNALEVSQLVKLFRDYGDLNNAVSAQLAKSIVRRRDSAKFAQVADLLEVIADQQQQQSSLTPQVFQALRIAVNQEYQALEGMLDTAVKLLMPQGILAVMTFHSGEERIVNSTMARLIENGAAEWLTQSELESGNYLRPSVKELRENMRSHSAKLFAVKLLHN